jgi:hypothetical protein
MLRTCLATLLALGSIARAADAPPAVRAHAVRRSAPITVDGRLDEAAWAGAPVHGGFIQRFPQDAAKPSFETRFAILYDDEAIYVGVWADDPSPDKIRALLTRRDVDSPGDSMTIAFDSYHDRRTAYAFQLNAAGVQRDLLLFDDSNQDDTWDAVWTGDVAMSPTGWTAEYRIPLSQLRFAEADAQEWGFQVARQIGRTGELDSWSPWPRSAPQVVSKFGVVDGIDHLQRARRLELLPFVTAGLDRAPVAAGDPLNQANGWRRNVGLDLKYGLGPAFTVSATLNPDFGQVEADPSKVNLSANELFFAEKRPFFLEGSDLFRLPIGNSDNGNEGAFYSRRIGAAPADPAGSYDYLKKPQSTAIYGAAKLTGKTVSGWSVGVLDAVTGPETAEISTGGATSQAQVAALTNFAIARVKRDLNDGATAIGGSLTAVHRKLAGTDLAATLHDQAYTGGLQLEHRWGDNAWVANVSTLGSWVHGTAEAIAATQTSSRHYFQRPDATDAHLDATRTSLAGMAARWMVGRLGDTKHWRFGTGGDLRTPGLELNDAGFQQGSDRMVPFVYGEYRDDAPGDHVLNWSVGGDVFTIASFDPRVLDYGLEYNTNVQLENHWSLAFGGNLDRGRWSPGALRGGPSLRTDTGLSNFAFVQTDNRAPVWFNLNVSGGVTPTSGRREVNVSLGGTVQARTNLDLFVGPSLYARRDPLQYVDQIADDAGATHYLFGRIHETDVSMTLRLNWTFSPHFALQAYAQPYVASGNYDELKDVDRPAAARYADRFHLLAPGEATLAAGTYRVMRDGAQYEFAQPDFNFRQLRSTVVVRWEYRPGSNVYAIWSHGRTSDAFDDGRLALGRDLGDLGRAASENVVMVKANYWIGL